MLKTLIITCISLNIYSCEIPPGNRWDISSMVKQGVKFNVQECESDGSNYYNVTIFLPKGLFKSGYTYLMSSIDCEKHNKFEVQFGVQDQDLKATVNVDKVNVEKSRFVIGFGKSLEKLNGTESIQKIIPIQEVIKYEDEKEDQKK